MRVWVDLTNSPHVLVLRPVVALLRERGAEVRVTVRDFAQTVGLCERLGLGCEVIGHHRGGRLAAKGAGLVSRSAALARWARGRRFDLALGHGSNDVTVAACALRVPRSTMFDYEWATVQHTVNCRLADAVVVPEAIPPERLDRYGARGTLGATRGSRRSTTCTTSNPTTPSSPSWVSTRASRSPSCARRPRCRSTTASSTTASPTCYERRRSDGQVVALPRTPEQRAQLARAGGFVVPERAIDAQSLVALADLVVSAGGTMNREAVALSTPVYTTFEGRLGAVDEQLIAEGRLRRLERPEELVLRKRDRAAAPPRVRRDPALLVDLLTAPVR